MQTSITTFVGFVIAGTLLLSGSVNAKVCCETPCDVSNPECETDW